MAGYDGMLIQKKVNKKSGVWSLWKATEQRIFSCICGENAFLLIRESTRTESHVEGGTPYLQCDCCDRKYTVTGEEIKGGQ